jgi:ABC-type multidrug transport system permease subunit
MSCCVWNDMITRIAVGKYVKQLVFGQFYELYEHFAICSKNDSSTHIGLYLSSLTIKIPGRIIHDAFAFPMTYLCSLLQENFGHELRLQRAFAICSKNSLYWGTSTSCNIKSPGGWIIFYAIPMKSFVPFSK